jgi:hypothetical protein
MSAPASVGGRLRRAALVAGLMGLMAGVYPTPAQAGFCAADRERVRIAVEHLMFDLEQLRGAFVLQVVQPLRLRAPAVLSRLALWALYTQSRQIVQDRLLAGGLDATAAAAVRELWQKAGRVHALSSPETAPAAQREALAGLDELLDRTGRAWAACRALRSGDVSGCRRLADRGQQLVAACDGLGHDLYALATRCFSVRTAPYRAWLSALGDRCRQRGDPPGRLCAALLAGLAVDRTLCRALARGDRGACRRAGLDEQQQRGCREDLTAVLYLKDAIDEQAFRAEYGGSFEDAIAAMGGARSCLQVALHQYDRSASHYFSLEPGWPLAWPGL